MEPIAQPIPNQVPKVITSMGSVFGSPLTGFNLVAPSSSPSPTTAERTAAIMPTDVLTQDVMTLKSELRELKNQIDDVKVGLRQVGEFLEKFVSQSSVKPLEPFADKLAVKLMSQIPLPPEKKKRGRPKKVVA